MKQKVILVAFIAVIAAGISFIYFGNQTTISTVSDTAAVRTVETAVVNDVEAIVSDVEEVVIETPSITPTTQTTNTTQITNTSATTSLYTDGTYTRTVSYAVPEGGMESITVTLTLVNGEVTALTIVNDADSRESERYQSRFESAIDAKVIGQSIEGLSVSRVGGASLTTRAFTNAVTNIIADAT